MPTVAWHQTNFFFPVAGKGNKGVKVRGRTWSKHFMVQAGRSREGCLSCKASAANLPDNPGTAIRKELAREGVLTDSSAEADLASQT